MAVHAVAVGFLLFVALAYLGGMVPVGIPALYLGASAVTFVAYAIDKSAARNGRWRTPENTLHLFALIGGWPGALVAQQMLRHKSHKQPFKSVLWLTVVANCAAAGWMLYSA